MTTIAVSCVYKEMNKKLIILFMYSLLILKYMNNIKCGFIRNPCIGHAVAIKLLTAYKHSHIILCISVIHPGDHWRIQQGSFSGEYQSKHMEKLVWTLSIR